VDNTDMLPADISRSVGVEAEGHGPSLQGYDPWRCPPRHHSQTYMWYQQQPLTTYFYHLHHNYLAGW